MERNNPMTDPFSTPPPPGGGIDYSELKGSLLLVSVRADEPAVPTKYGPADAIRADVDVLDGANRGDHNDDVLMFGKVIYNQLKRSVGGKILGRLGQLPAVGSNNPAWVLEDATEADKAIARAHLAAAAPAFATVGAEPTPVAPPW
jgi:hypothetical protein